MALQILFLLATFVAIVLAILWSVVAVMAVWSFVSMGLEDWGSYSQWSQWKMYYLSSQMHSFNMVAASMTTVLAARFGYSVSMRLQSYVVEEAYFLSCVS